MTSAAAFEVPEIVEKLGGERTVIRLKRRIEDDPTKAFIVSYKRLKTGGVYDQGPSTSQQNDSDEETNVIRLAATLPANKVEEGLASAVNKALLEDKSPKLSKTDVKMRRNSFSEKIKKNFKENIMEKRFKIVNSKRMEALNELENRPEDEMLNSEINNIFKVYDLIKEEIEAEALGKKSVKKNAPKLGAITCNGLAMEKMEEKEEEFVYDIYIADNDLVDSSKYQFISLHDVSLGAEGDFIEYREEEEMDEAAEDDEDSNDEDNWRNEYPDDDDNDFGQQGNGYDEDGETIQRFQNLLGTNHGDSSEDEVDLYDDGICGGFERRYAAYKLRKQRELSNQVVDSQSEEEDD